MKRSLKRIIYKNYLSSALIPIFAIELVLLLLYFGVSYFMTQKSQQMLYSEARKSLADIAKRETNQIEMQLQEVERLLAIMRSDHERFFNFNGCVLPNGEPHFATHANGAYYKTQNNGGSSIYYAATTILSENELRKARCSEMIDPLMQSIVENNPIVTQAYLNTYDDFNRLYPFMSDAPQQYGPNLHMQDYSFFYLADPLHNPEKLSVWTGAYLDPAGQGWMVSAVAPVYSTNGFEGVSGLDVTIGSLVQNILSLELPWNGSAFLVDADGMIIAMPEEIEQVLGLKELKAHIYKENIKETIEKPEAYNLLKTPNSEIRQQMEHIFRVQNSIATLTINHSPYMLAHYTIPQTGWRLMLLLNESIMREPILALKEQTDTIGYIVMSLMLFFYLAFFFYLLKKSKNVALQIATPIQKLSELTTDLGHHPGHQLERNAGITEVDQLIGNFNELSSELDARTQDYIQSQLREKMKAKDAEIAYRTGLFESASSYLHNIGNALTMLDAKTVMLLNTVSALKKSELGFKKIIAMIDASEVREQRNEDIKSFVTQFQKAMSSDITEELEEIVADIVAIKEHAVITIGHQQDIFNDNSEAKKNYIQKFDLNEMLVSLLEDYRLNFAFKGIDIALNADKPLTIATMKFQFQSGLSNVLKNAIESIEQCGENYKGKITVSAYSQNSKVHIVVTDNGIGVAPQHRSELFASGFTTKPAGHGLGLHAFNNFLNANDGTIELKSDGNMQGATVHITIGASHEQ